MTKNSLVQAGLAISGIILSGCIVERRHPHHEVVVRETVVMPPVGTEVIVRSSPPGLRREVIIARPSPAHIWIPGVWVWHRDTWVWESGRWELPPRAGAVWVPHRCVPRGGVHVFVHGGWRL